MNHIEMIVIREQLEKYASREEIPAVNGETIAERYIRHSGATEREKLELRKFYFDLREELEMGREK